MPAGVPQAHLSVIATAQEVRLPGVNCQTPQLICVPLQRGKKISSSMKKENLFSFTDTDDRFWLLTCVIGIKSPSKLPCKTKFFVVPMSTASPLPSAIVLMGPKSSGTCGNNVNRIQIICNPTVFYCMMTSLLGK